MWPTILFFVLLILLLVIFVIFFAAFDLVFSFKIDKNGYRGNLRVSFLRLSRVISIEDSKKEEVTESSAVAGRADKSNSATVKKVSSFISVFHDIKFPLLRLMNDTLRAIRFRSFSFNLKWGFADPADTGITCGFLYAILSMINTRAIHCDYQILPLFDEEKLEMDSKASLRFRFYRFVPGIIRFTTKKIVLKNLWILLRKSY